MIFLIDFDSILYKSVYKIVDIQTIKQYFVQGRTKDWMRKEITELSINRMTAMMDTIITEIGNTGIHADDIEYYLTVAPKSKRKELYPDYKVKRKPNRWVSLCRKYLLDCNFAKHHEEYEADDLVADRARELGESECLIVSMDKDLKLISGIHFSFYRPQGKKDEYGFKEISEMVGLSHVSKEEAELNFWTSMLTGDSTDGIKGVPGIGKVKAAKILSTSKNYKLSVIEAYQKYFKENWKYEYDKSYFNLYLGCNREEPELLDNAISDAVKLTKQLENSINV
jgi:hypothetical protein